MRASVCMIMAIATVALAAPGTVRAQILKTVECEDATDGSVTYLRFGDGAVHLRSRNGYWTDNLCDPSAICRWEGYQYRGFSEEGFSFTYRVADEWGTFFDMAGVEFEGTCRAYYGEPPTW